MAWVDLLLIAVLLTSLLIGVVRGLIFEVMSLFGWLVAYVAATWASPELAPHIPIGKTGSAMNHAASFAAAFIGALLLWALLSRLVRLLVRATPLSLLDRLLGAVFGGLRGAVVLLAVATVVSLTPMLRGSAGWQASQIAPWLEAALGHLGPLLPSQISKHLPSA